MRPYLIFYGTRTALIGAAKSKMDAFARFIEIEFPLGRAEMSGAAGRVMPPTLDEVRIRPIRAQDRAWIYDEFNGRPPEAWRRALAKVGA